MASAGRTNLRELHRYLCLDLTRVFAGLASDFYSKGLRCFKSPLFMGVFSIISNLAEEEGFYFVEYEADTCWHALVCYTRNVETKEFTVSLHKHCVSMILISPVFCSTAQHGVDQGEEGFLALTCENRASSKFRNSPASAVRRGR